MATKRIIHVFTKGHIVYYNPYLEFRIPYDFIINYFAYYANFNRCKWEVTIFSNYNNALYWLVALINASPKF